MIEQANKAWYVARRGELLAEQFLLELKPNYISPMQGLDFGIDYMAFFSKSDGTPIAIAIAVKATQQEIKGHYLLSSSQAQRLLNSNLPVLIIVIDVKSNNTYFNWIREAIPAEQKASLHRTVSCRIDLRAATPEELAKLRQEILAG